VEKCDLIIVGAGPYGLAAAAHLSAVRGFQYKIFGGAMEFWAQNMPAGMFLRSSWEASQIADPGRKLTLEAFMAAKATQVSDPIPLASFVEYGRWFQQQAASKLDQRKIKCVGLVSDGFAVQTEDGEQFQCRSVVVAAGIAPFANRPEEFSAVPPSLASHSSQHTGFQQFKGKRVLVLGGGQSALESGALLREAGADVAIIIRQPGVHWLRWRARITRTGLFGRLIYSPRDVGPPGLSQLVARPDYLKLLPRSGRDWIDRRSIRPAGAAWLMNRINHASIRTRSRISSAAPNNGRLRVSFDDGKEETVDHLLMATGYKINVAKYAFLSPEILSRLDMFNGYPRLRAGLESSIPGLYFLGSPAAWSFGPVARFVSGAHYCVPAMVRHVTANGKPTS
jgi:cation diffusion facilitator CzcD-associated flavoprotein CzcO